MSKDNFDVYEYHVPCQHVREYSGATRAGADTLLHLAVKKYEPKHRNSSLNGAFTVIAAGGNGFPKELYEPLWDDLLLQSLRSLPKSFDIRAIWIADMAHQGQSGIMNEEKIGDDPSWLDNARDLLQVVNHFRDEMTRPIVGIGHSIGATALINLSVFHPRLLSNLALVEPILGDCTREGLFFALHAVQKPDSWSSREEADVLLPKSPPFSHVDARVLQCWMSHGLRARRDSSGGVELTTSKHQEAVTYIRPQFRSMDSGRGGVSETTRRRLLADLNPSVDESRRFYCPAAVITLTRLPELRPGVLYVFGGKSVMSPSTKRNYIVKTTGTGISGSGGRCCGHVESQTLSKNGHLVTFENPGECAKVIAEYLAPLADSEDRSLLGLSFDLRTMQVSQDWQRQAKREINAMTAAKSHKL